MAGELRGGIGGLVLCTVFVGEVADDAKFCVANAGFGGRGGTGRPFFALVLPSVISEDVEIKGSGSTNMIMSYGHFTGTDLLGTKAISMSTGCLARIGDLVAATACARSRSTAYTSPCESLPTLAGILNRI